MNPSLTQPTPNFRLFNEFFGLGKEETASPFLNPKGRKWASHLTFKAALVAAFFLVVAFILSFYPHAHPLSSFSLLLVYFLAGTPSLIEAIEDILELDINIDILMTLAAFSSVLIGSSFEGALLLVLFSLSGAIEDAVTAKAKSSLSDLNKLFPSRATVMGERGYLIERSIKDILVGTKIFVRSGEIIPLDGVILDGSSSLNLAHLTGESIAVPKKPGDVVPAGAVNLEGTLTIEVTHMSSDSTLAKIIDLVTKAQEARPKLQSFFDKWSRIYASSIICLTVVFIFLLPYLFAIPILGIEGSIYRSLSFLIAASPCALILALPISYLSAINACARQGILLKGGAILDALARCKSIAFDKTGTLTTGSLHFKEVKSYCALEAKYSFPEVISIAYSLERHAVHPIAKGIVDYAEKNNLPALKVEGMKVVPGFGVQAHVFVNANVLVCTIGHLEYLKPLLNVEEIKWLEQELEQSAQEGKLTAILKIEKDLFILCLEDLIRPPLIEAFAKIKSLKKWRLIMLTGDQESNARKVAQTLGINEYHANLRPHDKLEYIDKLAQTEGLVMIGDGVNDAPSLARATVGICMGKVGSGAAIDAADIVLLQDNLEQIEWLIERGLKTVAIVHQNLYIAVGAILLASFPALWGLVPLWLAVILHEGGTVLVGLNALRLLQR